MHKIYLPPQPLNAAAVIQAVAEAYRTTPQELIEASRDRPALGFARQVAMYLCTELLSTYTLSEIGAAFHRKDHGTVGYARDKITEILLEAPGNEQAQRLAELIQQLRTDLLS